MLFLNSIVLFSLADSVCDIEFNANSLDRYIVWAIGGLGETAFRHFIRADSELSSVFLLSQYSYVLY